MESIRLNVAINTEDFAEVEAFYREVLGMPVESRWNEAEGPGIIFRAGNGQTLEFFGPPWGARQQKQPAAGVELAFEVNDVQRWHDRLVSAGVPIARELVDNPWGDRSFGIDDPAGTRIWILQAI